MSRRRNRRNNPRQASSPPQPVEKQVPRRPTLPEIDKAIRFQVQEAVHAELFSGPLPHPEHLAAYEQTLSGLAGRITRMAELQADHRRTTESKIVDSNIRLESRGQIFGFAIAMTALIGGMGLMAFDKSISGAAISLSALATLAGVFVWSKRQKSRELREKANPAAFGAEPTAPPRLPDSPSRN